jgi:conjugal transfer ATP-binding protein TraC
MFKKLLSPFAAVLTPSTPNFVEDGDVSAVRSGKPEEHVHDRFGPIFPFSAYDEANRIFQLDGAKPGEIEGLGFVIELTPQIGASIEMADALAAMLTRTVEPGAGWQISAFGSPDLEHQYDLMRRLINEEGVKPLFDSNIKVAAGENPRVTEAKQAEYERRLARWRMLNELTERRIAYYKKGAVEALFPSSNYRLRNIRCFLSLVIPVKMANEAELHHVKDVRDAIRAQLEAQYLYAYDWTANDHLYFLTLVNNPQRTLSGKMPVADYDDGKPLNEQMIYPETRVQERENEMEFSGENCEPVMAKCLSPIRYPSRLALPSMINLLGETGPNGAGYPCMYLITTCVSFTPFDTARSKLNAKAARAQQTADSQLARFMPASQNVNQDYKLIQHVLNNKGRDARITHQLVLWAHEKDIRSAQMQAETIWRSVGFDMAVDTKMQKASYLAAMPMLHGPLMQKDLDVAGRLSTKTNFNAANSLPLLSEFSGTVAREGEADQSFRRPIITTFGRKGQAQIWDMFANTAGNYNGAICGASGSGKSTFCNSFLIGSLANGDRAWVIDVGGSYKKLCSSVGGEYIHFGRNSSVNFNPFAMFQCVLDGSFFEVGAAWSRENQQDFDEDLAMMLPIINRMISSEMLTDFQRTQIAMHVQSVFLDGRLAGKVPTLDDLQKSLINNCERGGPNPLQDDPDWKHKIQAMTYEDRQAYCDPRIRDLGTQLSPYCEGGQYANWFDANRSVTQLSYAQFVVLELEELNNTPELGAVILMLLMRMITNAMYLGDRKQGQVVLIDEAWALMSGNSGEFIETGYRRARKYKGAFFSATQSIEDYFKSPMAQAALVNADWVCLLRQKPDSIQALKASNKFMIDTHTEEMLKSLTTVSGRFAEVFIRCPSVPPTIGRLLLDPYTLLMSSSRPDDVAAIDAHLAQGCDMNQAILNVLAQRGLNK